MYIYLLLIVFILSFNIFSKLLSPDRDKQQRIVLIVGMLAIYLLLALKKYTVGADTPGYMDQYYLSKEYLWSNYDYVYFENGYVVLMMLGISLGLSFQAFTAVLYAIICIAFYLFIKKHSTNTTLSLMIFICYEMFVFSISGLRQILAMALCIYAYLISSSKRRYSFLISIALITLSTYIHESSVVFYIVPVIVLMNQKVNILAWGSVLILSYIFRSRIWEVVQMFYGESDMTDIDLGGNFIFLTGIAFLITYTYYQRNKKSLKNNRDIDIDLTLDSLAFRVSILSLITYVVFSGGTMLRANMYFMMFLVPLLPAIIDEYDPKTRIYANIALTGFLLFLFYTETLLPNQLSLCPYRFFWE